MRISSDSDRQSADLQPEALQTAGVDARHLFEDHAFGAKDDRHELNKALELVRPGEPLVVWKLDRLGRSLSQLLTIINTLKDKQVAFRSLTEGVDTTSPSGELTLVEIKNRANRLGFAILLTFFREKGRFPRNSNKFGADAVRALAEQLGIGGWSEFIDSLCVERSQLQQIGRFRESNVDGYAPAQVPSSNLA